LAGASGEVAGDDWNDGGVGDGLWSRMWLFTMKLI
jgi:hypothetical protein